MLPVTSSYNGAGIGNRTRIACVPSKYSTVELYRHAYPRGESNPYAFQHLLLRQACLPFHHSGMLTDDRGETFPFSEPSVTALLGPHGPTCGLPMVRLAGVEPATSGLRSARLFPLSYRRMAHGAEAVSPGPWMVGQVRIEHTLSNDACFTDRL